MPTRVVRNLLDHVITLNEQYAWRALSEYTRDYHRARTHLALAKGSCCPRKSEWGVGAS